jgi:ribose 5-phosphate isomerase B
MQVYLASDHAGFYLKEKIREDFLAKGFLVEDFGAKNFDQKDDYPDFIYPCVKKFMQVTNGDPRRGITIVFGGSGTGEGIVADKVRGARTVVFNNESNLEIVRLGRADNNCNVLSVGARFVSQTKCLEAIKIFMTTQFEGGRHQTRVMKIDMLQ